MHQQHHVEKVRQAVARILMAVGRSTLRRLCVVVTLAFAVGSTSQPPLAQAAPPSQAERYVYLLTSSAAGRLDRICVGDLVVINVKAERLLANKFTYVLPDGTEYTNPPVQVAGVRIDGLVGNPDIGTLTPTRQLTSMRSTPPGSAEFKFVAKSPGTTGIYFTGVVFHTLFPDTNYLPPPPLEVKVINCKYNLTLVSKWKVGMTSVAVSTDGVLTADKNGYFTGSANIKWVTSQLCGIRSPIAPSKADLTGTLNESDQLVVKITFGPWSSSGGGPCTPIGGAITSNTGTLAPLTIEGAATRAVSTRQAQAIKAINGSFTGTANVIVIPVDGTK